MAKGKGGRGDSQFQRNNRRFSSQQTSEKPAGAELNGKKKQKKRRTNTLGLTPDGAEQSESEDEGVDEEARLVTLLGTDAPQYVAFVTENEVVLIGPIGFPTISVPGSLSARPSSQRKLVGRRPRATSKVTPPASGMTQIWSDSNAGWRDSSKT